MRILRAVYWVTVRKELTIGMITVTSFSVYVVSFGAGIGSYFSLPTCLMKFCELFEEEWEDAGEKEGDAAIPLPKGERVG